MAHVEHVLQQSQETLQANVAQERAQLVEAFQNEREREREEMRV